MTMSRVPARLAVPAVLAICAALGACAKKAPPPVVVALTPQEQACVDRAAAVTTAAPAGIGVVPSTSTKTGDMVYAVTANGAAYNCVVAPDGKVTSFTATTQP